MCLGLLQLLEHTRTTGMGLNRGMHLVVGGEAEWHRIGDNLSPKSYWRDRFPEKLGLLNLQLSEQPRTDKLPGRAIISVQPSTKYPFPVYFDVNNDIRPENDISTAFLVQVIREHWQRMFDEAKVAALDVLERALK